jgi:hypothetical protein
LPHDDRFKEQKRGSFPKELTQIKDSMIPGLKLRKTGMMNIEQGMSNYEVA